MDTTAVNLPGLQTTILFLLGVLAVFVAVDKGLDAFRHLFLARKDKREASQLERLERAENRLKQHDERLEAGDRRFDLLAEDLAQVLSVDNALLMHEITGNGIEKLKTVKSELDAYMASRGKEGSK